MKIRTTVATACAAALLGTGTIKAKNLNKQGTRTAVTITYS